MVPEQCELGVCPPVCQALAANFHSSNSGFGPPGAVDRGILLGILRLALQTGPTSGASLFDKS